MDSSRDTLVVNDAPELNREAGCCTLSAFSTDRLTTFKSGYVLKSQWSRCVPEASGPDEVELTRCPLRKQELNKYAQHSATNGLKLTHHQYFNSIVVLLNKL